jgi:hypothetical protein
MEDYNEKKRLKNVLSYIFVDRCYNSGLYRHIAPYHFASDPRCAVTFSHNLFFDNKPVHYPEAVLQIAELVL